MTALAADPDGSIWVGSYIGIGRYWPGTGQWAYYNAGRILRTGVGMASDSITSLQIDRRTSPRTASGASERSAPRALGMMQNVQWKEQPSCTFTKARVRSTDARPSTAPSSGLAVIASTPDRVGRAAARPSSPSASPGPTPCRAPACW